MTVGTEHLTTQHRPGYKRFAKRRWAKFVRREAKRDPENAPRKLRSRGWA
jgi:hypothetical protein